jgi:hypothetical protein
MLGQGISNIAMGFAACAGSAQTGIAHASEGVSIISIRKVRRNFLIDLVYRPFFIKGHPLVFLSSFADEKMPTFRALLNPGSFLKNKVGFCNTIV